MDLMREQTRKQIAEFIGTFSLVFAGTGAIVINDVSGGAITHVGVAITFGLIVLAMIYAIGEISGASMNPARSLAPAVVSGNLQSLWIYLSAPCLGAMIAVFSCRCVHSGSCCASTADSSAA